MIGAFCLGALVAAPLLYSQRSAEIWWVSIAAFAGLPLLVGLAWERPARLGVYATAGLISMCAAAALISEAVSVKFEMHVRDPIYLATASTVIFLGAAWLKAMARNRYWWRVLGLALLMLAGVAAVVMMTWMFLFFV